MKKFIKGLIIILIITIIVICCILFKIRSNNQRKKIQEEPDDPALYEYKINSTIQKVKIRNNFYIAKNCINKFYSYYMEEPQSKKYEADSGKTDNSKLLYSMLDQEYIDYKEITEDNILSKLGKMSTAEININNMYVYEENENISIYFAYGVFNDKINRKQEDFSIGVKVDNKNKTFKLLLTDFIKEKFNNLKIGDTIDITNQEEIKNDTYNIYGMELLTDDEYIEDIFNKLRNDFIYQPKLVYELLDEQYRNSKFDNYKEFEKYLKDNAIKNITMKIDTFQKTAEGDYIQYVCIDTKGNYYIFRETSVMNYTIILDTYTIDLPEFIEKYNSANTQVKVGMNIEKINDAINEKDYKYVYKKLDDTFKNSSYNTLQKFETFMKKNFYDNNDFEYKKYSEEGNTYIYELKVRNKNNNKDKEKDLTIIMQLKDETDFVMSFNIK